MPFWECVWPVPVLDDKMTALISPSPPMNRHRWPLCVHWCHKRFRLSFRFIPLVLSNCMYNFNNLKEKVGFSVAAVWFKTPQCICSFSVINFINQTHNLLKKNQQHLSVIYSLKKSGHFIFFSNASTNLHISFFFFFFAKGSIWLLENTAHDGVTNTWVLWLQRTCGFNSFYESSKALTNKTLHLDLLIILNKYRRCLHLYALSRPVFRHLIVYLHMQISISQPLTAKGGAI